jgi:alkanesulfonate monooxygenase SsuD/methylene tetrahydromethanopterin reductase-like flavin-dependent oxidoreductase (luciferase family)
LLQAEGRQPSAIKRTVTVPVFCGRIASELEEQTRGLRRFRRFASMPLRELGTDRNAIMGTPEEVVARIQAYAAVSVEEVLVRWFTADDINGLEVLAKQVLPHVAN